MKDQDAKRQVGRRVKEPTFPLQALQSKVQLSEWEEIVLYQIGNWSLNWTHLLIRGGSVVKEDEV